MALDEYLYAKVTHFFKRRKKNAEASLERRVELESVKDKLTILARAATGKPIEIYPAEREGGFKNNAFFLPSTMSLFPEKKNNLQFYTYRTLFLSVQSRLQLNWSGEDKDQSLEHSRAKAEQSAEQILPPLFSEYPALESWYHEYLNKLQETPNPKLDPDLTWLYGKWMVNTPEVDDITPLQNISEKVKKAEEEKPKTTLQAKAIEEIKSVTIDKKQQEDYVLNHNFEKVDTAEEFNGVWRDFDGDDDLQKHQNAMDELDMKFTVRVDDTTHSIYQAQFIENANVSESAETNTNESFEVYDEWDYQKNRYKPSFCKIYPSKMEGLDIDYYTNTLFKNQTTLVGLRKILTSINNRMQQQRRQKQGAEFDLDALTDRYIDIHSKHNPSENIYIDNRKTEKDLSITLLLDISLSADGYAAGNRVIDVEKEVSILFGEILNEYNIDFSISCFHSKTRNYNSFVDLKSFDDKWDQAKHVIGLAQPAGYTRIGVAIRHAGAILASRPSKKKWLILLSDGKPNDYDKYEGKYGIQDVKQALRELNERDVNSYALAIEAQAKYYLPQMFGQNHYQILTTPVELLSSMVKLYSKIKFNG